MQRIGKLLFLLLGLIHLSISQNFSCSLPTPVTGAPSLPNVTNQFTTYVEANIENKGYTVNAVEYYDEPNNRGRLDFSGDNHGESSLIYTYSDQQWFHINSSHCTAHSLQPNDTFLAFPINLGNQGNAHIRGISDVLFFGKKYNETYVGQEEVRGIMADHWKTCADTRFGGSMSLDWYFAVDEWTSEGHGTPLRLVIEGTDPNMGRNDASDDTNGWHYFKHSYDFVFFEASAPADSVFQIPRGMFCDGSKSTKSIPFIPENFSARLQLVNAINNTIYHLTEVHNRNTQKYVFRAPHLTVVQDFRLGLGFFLSGTNCTAMPLSVSLLYQFSGEQLIARLSSDKKHLQLKSAKSLFGISDNSNTSYIGTRTVNEIPCDVFSEERRDFPHKGNITIIELSFARKSLNYLSPFGDSEQQVPIRYEQYSKSLVGRIDHPSHYDFHQIFNVYDFSVSTDNVEEIEMEHCYTSSITVWFQLDGKFDSLLDTNGNHFATSIIDSVAEAAQIDISRITRVTPIKLGDGFLIQVTLLGSLHNDTLTTYVSTGVSLEEAISNLQDVIDEGKLNIVINQTQMQYQAVSGSLTATNPAYPCMLGNTTTVSVPTVLSTTARKVSVSPTSHTMASSKPPEQQCPNNSDLSQCREVLAALGLAMFIMGFAAGCILFCCIIHRKRGFDDYNYDRHDPI